ADIEHATRIARAMVCTFGMNDKIGPVLYYNQDKPLHVRSDGSAFNSYSPETAREIDNEIKLLLDQAHDRAKAMLMEKRDDLEKLSLTLLEKETLDVTEVKALLGMSTSGNEDKNEIPLPEIPPFGDNINIAPEAETDNKPQ
ncbi:MAG: hypothetical protein JXR78_02135, partial [Victivallales bacterium]|nr:hypothetical protein [Victivallales bacterium]